MQGMEGKRVSLVPWARAPSRNTLGMVEGRMGRRSVAWREGWWEGERGLGEMESWREG